MRPLPFLLASPFLVLLLACGGDNNTSTTGSGGSGGSGGGSGGSAGAGGSGGGSGGGGGGGGGVVSGESRCVSPDDAAPAIYVSASGDDQAMGTKDAPVRTFARAFELRASGQDVRVFGGTYTEKLLVAASGTAEAPIRVLPVAGEKVVLDATGKAAGKPIDVTGSHVLVQGFEVVGSENIGVDVPGSDVVLCQLDVHDCVSHGIQIGGARVWAEGNRVHDSVLENQGGGTSSGWGSGLKVKVGGEDVTLIRNRLYHNWGEGVAVTRGKRVLVRENLAYDNFSVNFYVDNAYEVVVERNLARCTANSGFERDGKRASAFMIGEEYYDGWGAQLHDVTIRNNIAFNCNRGFLFAGSDVDGGLKDVAIVHNTLWGSVDTALSIAMGTPNQGVLVHGNLVQQPEGKTVWIEDLAGITVSHQFWVGAKPADWTNGNGEADRIGDPGLYGSPGPTAASYRLGETSTARDASLPLPSLVTEDFEGRERDLVGDAAPDMGAMEYGDPAAPCAFDELWK